MLTSHVLQTNHDHATYGHNSDGGASDRQYDAPCWIDCNETVLIFKRVILYIFTQFTVSSNRQDLYHTNVCFNLSNIPKGKLFFSSRTPDIRLYCSVYSQQTQMYFIPTS